MLTSGDESDPLDPNIPFVREVSTYVQVARSPLRVLMLEGGISSILRGYDQWIHLTPANFSGDPDYPEHAVMHAAARTTPCN